MEFKGRTFGLHIGQHVVVRRTPEAHAGGLPPVPHAGAIIVVKTVGPAFELHVVEAHVDRLVMLADGVMWLFEPVRPDMENNLADYVEGSGSSDWVCRTRL